MSSKWIATSLLALGVTAGVAAVPTAASAETSWRLFGGLSTPEDLESSYYGYDLEVSAESGFVVGGAIGMTAGDFVLEAELAHRSADLDEATLVGIGSAPLDGELSATSIMTNAWFNFPTGGNFGFYAGGGAGLAQAEATITAFGYSYTDDSTEFVWQLGGGLGFKTDSGFTFGVGYRYFNVPEIGDTDIEISTHDFIFEIGSRF